MFAKVIISGIIGISLIARNKPMVIGGIIVLILSFLNSQNTNRFLKDNLLDIGLVFLIVWLLLPVINNSNNLPTLNVKSFFNLNGLVSFLSGLFVVTVAGKGLNYLKGNTSAIGGIILGSVIGVTFLEGIPVGMLTASGIAYLITKLIRSLF